MKTDRIGIKEIIAVEGKYDAALVRAAVDAVVVELGGFRIFNDKKKLEMISKLSAEKGIIILTDSDGAGLVIRNRIKAALPHTTVKNAYIPQIPGKERRKSKVSKSGFLGVEGMDKETVLSALLSAGATVEGGIPQENQGITRADFYRLGLLGGQGSSFLRKKLEERLGIPDYLSVTALIDYINASGTDIEPIIREIKGEK